MVDTADLDEMKLTIHNDQICKKIGYAITKVYPDRRWYIRIFDKGKLASIILHSVNQEYGMTVHMLDSEKMNIRRCIKAAGEALERFNLTRGRSDNADVLSLVRNTKGDVFKSDKGELQ